MTSALAGDLEIEIVAEGGGLTAMDGMQVSVHYRGELQDGTIFDDSSRRGQPIRFILGQGQVIPGWEQGVTGMKVGEVRKLTIPSELGYGSSGAGNVIPPDAILIFTIELLEVSMPATLSEVSATDVLAQQAKGTLIIDIRREDEWRDTGVIKDAHLITAFQNNGGLHPEFQDKFFSLVPDPDTPVLIYCRSAGRSRMLGHALIDQLGFTHVSHLTGGMNSWLENGFETQEYDGN